MGLLEAKELEDGDRGGPNLHTIFVISSKIYRVRCGLWARYCYRKIRITKFSGHVSGREGYSLFVLEES
jgi:hypothetical protein